VIDDGPSYLGSMQAKICMSFFLSNCATDHSLAGYSGLMYSFPCCGAFAGY
jgi:hypothetical protein